MDDDTGYTQDSLVVEALPPSHYFSLCFGHTCILRWIVTRWRSLAPVWHLLLLTHHHNSCRLLTWLWHHAALPIGRTIHLVLSLRHCSGRAHNISSFRLVWWRCNHLVLILLLLILLLYHCILIAWWHELLIIADLPVHVVSCPWLMRYRSKIWFSMGS